MPYKDPKKQAAYLRKYQKSYMRVYRRQKKDEEAARREATRLTVIGEMLSYYYVGIPHDKEYLEMKPKVETVPVYRKKTESDVITATEKVRVPIVDKASGEVIGHTTVEKKVPVIDSSSGEQLTTARVWESAPESWKPYLKRIQNWCMCEGKHVSEARILKDMKFHMDEDAYVYERLSDLMADARTYKEFYLVQKMNEMPSATKEQRRVKLQKIKELQRMQQTRSVSTGHMERFALALMLQGKSDDEIVEAARNYQGTEDFFRFWTTDYAKYFVASIREILHPKKEKKGVLSDEEAEQAIEAVNTQARMQEFIAAKRLVDERKKRKRLGLPLVEKKKKKRYTVTKNED